MALRRVGSKEVAQLSHGGRYYREHKARELERKRIERSRLGSAALAFVKKNPTFKEQFAPQEKTRYVGAYRWLDHLGRERKVESHTETFWSLSRTKEKEFRAFLREKGWSAPSHSTRRVSFKQKKARRNFLAEGLGDYWDDGAYGRVYGGR